MRSGSLRTPSCRQCAADRSSSVVVLQMGRNGFDTDSSNGGCLLLWVATETLPNFVIAISYQVVQSTALAGKSTLPHLIEAVKCRSETDSATGKKEHRQTRVAQLCGPVARWFSSGSRAAGVRWKFRATSTLATIPSRTLLHYSAAHVLRDQAKRKLRARENLFRQSWCQS